VKWHSKLSVSGLSRDGCVVCALFHSLSCMITSVVCGEGCGRVARDNEKLKEPF